MALIRSALCLVLHVFKEDWHQYCQDHGEFSVFMKNSYSTRASITVSLEISSNLIKIRHQSQHLRQPCWHHGEFTIFANTKVGCVFLITTCTVVPSKGWGNAIKHAALRYFMLNKDVWLPSEEKKNCWSSVVKMLNFIEPLFLTYVWS